MAIGMNLYPPIVPDTIPAFDRTQSCRIYFSLPVYGSRKDIFDQAQVSLISQKTNLSAFDKSEYPSGIKCATIYIADEQNDYNYYVEIESKDLINKVFELNQYYKVQIRTMRYDTQKPSDGVIGATWLYNNKDYFSEWSKVCLIKGISKPEIKINEFDNLKESDQQETVFTNPIINITGSLFFDDKNEIEYLRSYKIKLYYSSDENFSDPLMVSEDIYPDQYASNEFNYTLEYDLLDGISYTLRLEYTTNNLYTGFKDYSFTVIQYGIDVLNANITATPDEENGRIKVNILSKNFDFFIGNLIIRRTSSESNFHRWEDIKYVSYAKNSLLDYTLYDTTIESGVWYKYCAQKIDANGHRGIIIQTENPVMCILDHIFLTKNNCQLKIQFNPSLNQFKYNVNQSQQVAIGSKYPFIKRNGNNYFRSFPIGGLISSFIDTTNWYDPHFNNNEGRFQNNKDEIKMFTSKQEIYGESKTLYDNYNNNNNITQYNDYIYERKFREKVYEFLYAHDVKLFRSTTEGNILIKLMNIDFQPVESLGRRLYSFTATAIEVDEANISNYNKYKIQEIGEHQSIIAYNYDTLGQIYKTFTKDDGNIIAGLISNKYNQRALSGFKNNVNYLKWLEIEIESSPYAIIESNEGLTKVSNLSTSNLYDKNVTVGHIVIINGVEMIIYPRIQRRPIGALTSEIKKKKIINQKEIINLGIFELKGEDTEIKSLSFKYPTTAIVNYVANIQEEEDVSESVSQVYYYRRQGQLYGTFNPQDSLMQKIYNKYFISNDDYYQRLLDITGIQLESNPGTVVYVRDSKDSNFNRHILENGYLQLKDDDAMIEGLYFCGIHLTESEREDPNQYIGMNEYVLIDGEYNSLSEITNPIPNGVYKILNGIGQTNSNTGTSTADGNSIIDEVDYNYNLLIGELSSDNKYIYYNDKWYIFTTNNDVLCPIDGIVDYTYELVKGVYQKNDI